LEFDLLTPYSHVVHAVFAKHGGTSQGPYRSLNLSSSVGDHPDCVSTNRKTIRDTLGLDDIVYAQQNHGSNVHRVTIKNKDKVPVADALFTMEKGIGLAVTHADCQAAMFYDPVHEAIAVAHSGWQGTVQNIYGRVIDTMHREIGTQAHNLLVCISPSLGPDHAEYKNYRQELPQNLWQFQTSPNHFDFWAISQAQLAEAGVLEKNIELASVCTVCENEDYFSYRASKDTGRNATVIALKS
jgi:YfiH family protein